MRTSQGYIYPADLARRQAKVCDSQHAFSNRRWTLLGPHTAGPRRSSLTGRITDGTTDEDWLLAEEAARRGGGAIGAIVSLAPDMRDEIREGPRG
jgi:hypothetical protein